MTGTSAPHRVIYIACPWGPHGGGMFKVCDYLVQAQMPQAAGPATELRPLDTRGAGRAALSPLFTLLACLRLLRDRTSGRLAGVHVNMAERMSLVRKCLVILWCRLIGTPVVLHLHAAQLHSFYKRLPEPLRVLVRWTFRRATRCVVLGSAALQFVTEELKVSREQVDVVINGVPPATEPHRARAAGAPLRVIFLGNLSERKGVSDLLEAMALTDVLPPSTLELTLIGGGDLEGYRVKASNLGVADRVRFAGWADQAAADRLLANADVLVLPSYDEGLPLVILEAMARGLAVVCTPVGEIPAVFRDGVDALFVPPGQPHDIAQGLRRVLVDDDFRQRLGDNGRALYEQHFSLQSFFEAVAAVHHQAFGVSAQLDPALKRVLRGDPK